MPASVSVSVNLNAEGVRSELQSIDDLINRLNGKSANIKVNVNGSGGSGGMSGVTRNFVQIEDAVRNASLGVEEFGTKTKTVTTLVDGETKKVTETFKKGVGQQVQVSSDGTTKITQNFEAQQKAEEKYYAQWEKDTLKAIEFNDKAVDADIARRKEAEEAAKKAAEAERKSADARIAQWGRIAKAAAAALIIKETRDALNTMKEVDSELANIQKVTDQSSEAIAALGDRAYDTASKYGVSATEYLKGAADFAKAGYSNYDQLAELAIKTQLVGDVSAETASKFLLSADAAYKFGGNVDQLSTVLDRANIIENNYATSIDKIAQGMPIVASTAAMANMSIDELMAGLGTITAVTQETGRKAATALRALILNIEGQIGTVIDEDMTITQESVESMADALKKYGNEAVKAAQKTGELIDPMEAIKSLAEAYKNGDLNDQELYDILSSLGGKLRTNQLTALVTNFDMFSSMLEKVKTSAGSADKEVSVMLDTWESKTNILKNTWTNFVSDLIDTKTIKSGIDLLTNVIDGLDKAINTEIGDMGFKFVALTTVITKAASIIKTVLGSSFALEIGKSISAITAAISGGGGLGTALAGLGTTLIQSPLAWGVFAAAGVLAFTKLSKTASEKYQEAANNVDNLVAKYNELYGENGVLGKEIDSLSHNFDSLNEQEKTRLGILQAQEESMRKQVMYAKQAQIEQWQETYGTGTKYVEDLWNENSEHYDPTSYQRWYNVSYAEANLKEFESSIGDILNYGAGKLIDGVWVEGTQEDINQAIAGILSDFSEYYDGLKEIQKYGEITDPYELEFIRQYERDAAAHAETIHKVAEAKNEEAAATQNLSNSNAESVTYVNEASNAAKKMTEQLSSAISTGEDFDAKSYYQGWYDEISGVLGEYEALSAAGLEFNQTNKEAMSEWSEIQKILESGISEGRDAEDILTDLNSLLDNFTYTATDAAESSEGMTDANEETAGSLEEIAEAADSAAAALKRYQEAASGGKEDNAAGYRSAYQQFLGDWQAGKNDTNAVNAAMDLFFTDDMRRSMGYDMQAMGEMLASDLYQGIFNGASGDAGVDFANYIRENMTEGLAEIAKITENGDGTFNFEYASAQKLADYFKLPLPAIQALLGALDNYGIEVEMGWEDTQNLADALGLVGENGESSGKTIQDVADGLVELGHTDPEKISSLIKTLGESGFIEGFEDMSPEEIGTAIATALGLIEPPEIPAEVEVDEGQVEGEVESAAEGAEPKVEAEVEISTGEGDTLEDTETTVTATVEGTEEVAALADEQERVEDKTATTTMDVVDNGLSDMASVYNSLQNKTVTVTFNAVGKIPPFAEGTKNAPGGMALVNELGPELISDNGRAYIANGGKPAIVNLSKGAIVLTAEETRRAIGSVGAYDKPFNAYASGIPIATVKSGGSGGGSSEKSSRKSSKEKDSDPWKDMEKELKDTLSDYDDIAEWYHNQKKHDEEANVYFDAIAKINEARDKYLEAGFAEDSAEVARLANKIYDYEEDIRDAHQHAIDDLEDELDLLDDQIELAENQGDIQKALELEREAQAKVAELLQRYREAGYEDTSEEVLKLANKGYDYASDTDSYMKDLWSDLIDALEAMKDTQDDANDLAEKQLAVDEARDALQKAQNQRTVRVFNPVTGQWEWIADAKNIADAEERLKDAEEALTKEQQSQELDALKKLSEKGGNLGEFTLGPGISTLLAGANTDDMTAFATALGLLSGGMTTTADTSSKSIFDSVDSHDTVTQYTFNGVTIDANTAQNTTLADLVTLISPLAITTNMPA